MGNELKEAAVANFNVIPRHLLGETNEKSRTTCQYSQSSGPDFNQGPSEYQRSANHSAAVLGLPAIELHSTSDTVGSCHIEVHFLH
jgi:hypothetical protein